MSAAGKLQSPYIEVDINAHTDSSSVAPGFKNMSLKTRWPIGAFKRCGDRRVRGDKL
ncbi:hypothetical protein O9992_30395 [Vibrio lentus]|nr:hypothetical protein [Vibrio lentus]